MRKYIGFWILLVLNPALWWALLNVPLGVKEYSKSGQYMQQNSTDVFSNDKIDFLLGMRSVSSSPIIDNSLYKRVLYNKIDLVTYGLLGMTKNLNPSVLFVPISQENIPSIGIEFVPIVLLPFWFMGLVKLITRRRLVLLAVPPAAALLAGFVGKTNIYFLVPMIVVYSYYAYVGVHTLKSREWRKASFVVIALYCVFSGLRMLLINPW